MLELVQGRSEVTVSMIMHFPEDGRQELEHLIFTYVGRLCGQA